jgi:hypothetical protein
VLDEAKEGAAVRNKSWVDRRIAQSAERERERERRPPMN